MGSCNLALWPRPSNRCDHLAWRPALADAGPASALRPTMKSFERLARIQRVSRWHQQFENKCAASARWSGNITPWLSSMPSLVAVAGRAKPVMIVSP